MKKKMQGVLEVRLFGQIIQLMKRETPFKLAAQSSLKVMERDAKMDKALMHTLQGGHDLRQELTKTLNAKGKITATLANNTFESVRAQKQMQKSEAEALEQQVAALDNFKAPVTREKTKVLIQGIKLRRREKHLQAYGVFKQDLEDYKDNLLLVYSSLENDLSQVLSIKENQLKEYLSSLSDQYLLTRNKQILKEISKEIIDFQQAVKDKLRQSQDELERIRNDRKGLVEEKCKFLFMELVQIAFVLEDEAKSISDKEKSDMQKLEEDVYGKSKVKISTIGQNQKQLFSSLQTESQDLHAKWKTLNEDKQIQTYHQQADGWPLRWPESRAKIYKQIVSLQTTNTQRKYRLISNLAKQHPDTITKANIDKWNEHLKTINIAFNEELDRLIKLLMDQSKESEETNKTRYEKLRQKLNYIEKRSAEEVEQLLIQKCEPRFKRNIDQTNELLKQVTNYVEDAEERQNGALQKLSQFLAEVGTRNDDFSKKWASLSQEYEVDKAKILDEDDEIVDKLKEELKNLKQQLREALHHIKLQQVQKACFEKIDQLQKSYRQTHQNNKTLASKRPQAINKFMNDFEAKIAQAFSLYDQSKKAQLIERSKKEADEIATKRLEEQQRKKAEEEAIAIEESKKKGGKAPPPAKKDPKKAQAEMQERKKALILQIGLRQIEEVKTGSGSVWLAYRSLIEICSEFYKREGSEGDQLNEQIISCRSQPLVNKKALVSAKEMAVQLGILRDNYFARLGEKKARVLQEAQQLDNGFVEQSLTNLDERLREHYSLKGKLEAQVGVVRSGEITNHKKEYQKHVRTVKDKMDLQTQKFNYLLEKSLQLIKTHNADQKAVKEQLTQGKNLADFQSCHRKAHENNKNITRQMQEIGKQLSRLSSVEVETILTSNQQFIKKTKLLQDGGEFSVSQLDWYKQMMKEVNDQITQQRDKRADKTKEVQDHIEKRSKELIEQFDKDYNIFLEDLSAREGTGKKYGRPKRIAQEKLRLEMNKCEQAQISIDNQITAVLEVTAKGAPHYPIKPDFLLWRQKLMTLQSCIVRYARHIQAIVPACKARVMPRITRLEGVSDALLTPEQQQEDKKKIAEEFLQLGPLGEQKDDKIFMKFLQDIEKIIGDQARTIYVGDKAKYINGNDKLPDFLRLYIQNMRKNAEQFRQESIRHLRESCAKLSSISQNIIELFYHALQIYFGGSQASLQAKCKTELDNTIIKHQHQRGEHLKQLRPNLSNPKCQQELKTLDETEQKRQQEFIALIKEIRKKFEDDHFDNASKFLYSLLNNYELLLLFVDSLYLPEDFVKVAGDDVQEKVHLDAKRLLLMKQKGISIDANSERNIKKKWEGVVCTLFNFGDKKFTNVVAKPQETKEKDKKGSKKEAKGAKVEQSAPVNPDVSKVIETYKTWRQKAVFTNREQTVTYFGKEYQRILSSLISQIQKSLKQNDSFKLKWEAIAKSLYVS